MPADIWDKAGGHDATCQNICTCTQKCTTSASTDAYDIGISILEEETPVAWKGMAIGNKMTTTGVFSQAEKRRLSGAIST